MLTEHGCPIAPSTFYDVRSRRPSRRAMRDAELVEVIAAERDGNRFVAGLGARKMWLRLLDVSSNQPAARATTRSTTAHADR